MEEILGASALSLGRAIQAKRVSSAEVVAAYLQRIDQVNPTINAVVQRVDERARAEAAAADAALVRGESGGTFHGVPFTVKDIFDVAGVVSAAGLVARAASVPERDAVVVARMRGAGAILLGKSNSPPGRRCRNRQPGLWRDTQPLRCRALSVRQQRRRRDRGADRISPRRLAPTSALNAVRSWTACDPTHPFKRD